ATILNIGVAALATFIGAGGLGDIIVRGLNVMDNNLILSGIAPERIKLLSITLSPLTMMSTSPPAPINVAKAATPILRIVAVRIPAIRIGRVIGSSTINNIGLDAIPIPLPAPIRARSTSQLPD